MQPLIHIPVETSATFISDLHGKPGILQSILNEENIDERLQYERHIVVVLGDFLDGGTLCSNNEYQQGSEMLLDMLVEYTKQYPEQFFVLFGNHEFEHYKKIVFNTFSNDSLYYKNLPIRLTQKRIDFFNNLHIAAVLKKHTISVLAAHSGIPRFSKLSCLNKFSAPHEIIESSQVKEFLLNQPAWLSKTGKRFSMKKLKEFLDKSGINGFIRGHSGHNRFFEISPKHFLINVHTTAGMHTYHEGDKYYYAVWNDKIPDIKLRKCGGSHV